LARYNLNKLHTFGKGNIKWGPVKKVIANTHFSVFNIKSLNRLRRLRQKHLNSSTSLCPFSDKGVNYVIYSVSNSRMLYVGQTCKSAFERFQEHIREAKRLSQLASSSFDFKPLYAAIAKEGFHSFRVFPIEKVNGNFFDSEGRFALNLFKVVASQLERKWMSILHTFFPRGYNLEGKSNNQRSPRVHKAFAMLWRKGSKPSFARRNNKVWVPVNVLLNVAVSLPPTLPVSEEIGAPSDDVQPNQNGVPHLSPHRIFGYRDYKRRLVFLSSLMSKGKFSIVFLSNYKTKNLVCRLLLLSEVSPSVLSLDVGHALQLSKILCLFIKRNVPRSFSSSASFLGKDLIISVFVSSCMDGLSLSSILNLPSVLDCHPPFVRRFWSPPLVAW